jgi:hypothetical protein
MRDYSMHYLHFENHGYISTITFNSIKKFLKHFGQFGSGYTKSAQVNGKKVRLCLWCLWLHTTP